MKRNKKEECKVSDIEYELIAKEATRLEMSIAQYIRMRAVTHLRFPKEADK